MFIAVLFPIPLGPRIPVTFPIVGPGSPYNAKPFLPYLWVASSSFSGSPIIIIEPNGQRLTHIPHPEHNSSEMTGFSSSPRIIVSSPVLTPGQNLIHWSPHIFGWHLSRSRTASLDRDRCQPKMCGLQCIKFCPGVRTGDETIILGEDENPSSRKSYAQDAEYVSTAAHSVQL